MQTFYYCFFYNAAVVACLKQLPLPQDLVFVFGDSRAKHALISISLTFFFQLIVKVIDWSKYIIFMSHLHFLDETVWKFNANTI